MKSLIGKKCKVQLMEDGILPNSIIQTCTHYQLNPVALLNRELTISEIHENSNLSEPTSDFFQFKETDAHPWKPKFLGQYFQISITNHPLTTIFTDV